MLNREPMWLKFAQLAFTAIDVEVSVLNREPMWLKCRRLVADHLDARRFSAQP